jgi:hypothetical protein
MTDIRWTPSLVEERLVEAADVLKRLPERKAQGYFNTWPAMSYEFSDLVGRAATLSRPPPSSDAIRRMEDALTWTIGLDPVDSKIVWLRASGVRWKVICGVVGLKRSACNDRWIYGLCMIAEKLNGRPNTKTLSRRRVIMQHRVRGSA